MSLTGSTPAPHDRAARPGATAATDTVPARWDIARGVLLALLGVAAVATLLVGVRPASWNDLTTAVSDGRVHEVHVIGAMSPGYQGDAIVDVLWHDGSRERVSTVHQVVDPAETGEAGTIDSTSPYDDVVVHGDLVEHVRVLAPSGELRVTTEEARTGVHGRMFGWWVPVWVSLAWVAGALLTLVALVVGPVPRRATRWAWFWLMWGLGVGGPAAYLLFGLPRGGAPARPTGRLLTGGRAFLLALLIGAVMASTTG